MSNLNTKSRPVFRSKVVQNYWMFVANVISLKWNSDDKIVDKSWREPHFLCLTSPKVQFGNWFFSNKKPFENGLCLYLYVCLYFPLCLSVFLIICDTSFTSILTWYNMIWDLIPMGRCESIWYEISYLRVDVSQYEMRSHILSYQKISSLVLVNTNFYLFSK